MPARSAAMLIVFAASRARTTARSSQLGNRRLKFPAKPCPVTIPIRAHIICTAAISGHVRSAVQRRLVPSCAPATEYVAMPDGSSSAAPVMTPGPSAFNSDRIHRDGVDARMKKSERKLPTKSQLRIRRILHDTPYKSSDEVVKFDRTAVLASSTLLSR